MLPLDILNRINNLNIIAENIKNVDSIINLCGILFENKSGDFFRVHKDVTAFLAWTAEPELEERKSLGVKTLFFLVLITIMLLGVKRKIWKDLD